MEESWRFGDQVRAVLSEVPGLLLPDPDPADVRLAQASVHADLTLATDYVASLAVTGVSVALRVRGFHLLRRYGREVVLRDSNPTGHPTEAEKVLADSRAASLYLYAFSDPTGQRFIQWVLLDLVRLRLAWGDPDRRTRLGAQRVLFGGSSAGLAFPLDELQRAQVVLRSLTVCPAYHSLTEAIHYLETNARLCVPDPQ